MKFFTTFYSIVIKNCIILKRWNKVLACMIKKVKGLRVDKLNIIQLIQANLQMVMRKILILVHNKVFFTNKLKSAQYV